MSCSIINNIWWATCDSNSMTLLPSFIQRSHRSIMKLEIGAITKIVCICWGVSHVTNPPSQGLLETCHHGSAKTDQLRCVFRVGERHICQNSSPVSALWVHLVWYKAQKMSKLITEGHFISKWAASCTCRHILHRCVRLLCKAVAFQLPVFTQALSLVPLQYDLFGLTQMTHLVWRNIPVTWLEASQHLLLWIKCTPREVAGVVYKNAHLNAAQTHTHSDFFCEHATVGMFFLMNGTF